MSDMRLPRLLALSFAKPSVSSTTSMRSALRQTTCTAKVTITINRTATFWLLFSGVVLKLNRRIIFPFPVGVMEHRYVHFFIVMIWASLVFLHFSNGVWILRVFLVMLKPILYSSLILVLGSITAFGSFLRGMHRLLASRGEYTGTPVSLMVPSRVWS